MAHRTAGPQPITRRTAILLIASALAGGATGCSLSPRPPAPSQERDRDSIELWHSFTQGSRQAALNRAVAAFEAARPGVTVRTTCLSWPEFKNRWRAGMKSGDLPDISTACNLYEMAELMHEGLLQPVDDLVDAIGRERFLPNVLKDITHEGAFYGIPYYSHAYVLWYRTNLLEKTGIAVPRTWEDFSKAAKALTDPSIDAYGYAVALNPSDQVATLNLHMYLYSGGESLLNDDLTANLTSDLALEGIRYWADLYRTCSPADAAEDDTLSQAAMFYNGTTSFDFNSGFHVEGIASTRPDLLDTISCAPLPKMRAGDEDYSALVTHIPLVLYKDARDPELCREFLGFLFEDENYLDFLDSVPVGMLPTVSGIDCDPRYKDNPLRQQFAAEEAIIEEAVLSGHPLGFEHGPNLQSGILTSSGVIERMFLAILQDGVKVEEAARDAERELNELFEAVRNKGERGASR